MATVYEEINLRKDKVIDLAKKKNITTKAQVIVALDYSGSMDGLYRSGEVQRLLERLLPIGMAMDNNEEIDFFLFHDRAIAIEPVTVSNIKNFIDKKVMGKYNMGGTNYAPIINAITKKCGGSDAKFSLRDATGGGFLSRLKAKAKEVVLQVPTPQKFKLPVYVIFITDGENSDHEEADAAIKNASHYGIFFQFIGIGSSSFSFLKHLDEMEGRVIDNANFFPEPDLAKTSDDKLYELLFTEYPSWLPQAKAKGLIE